MLATLTNSLRVARLTNCQRIPLWRITIVLRRNCAIACRSPMRIGQSRRCSPGSRHQRRHRHSLGSFDPRNRRGHRRFVLLHTLNRSSREGCRSPHSKRHHRANRRPDARHSSDRKLVAARRQVSGRVTNAISFSSVRSLLGKPLTARISYFGETAVRRGIAPLSDFYASLTDVCFCE